MNSNNQPGADAESTDADLSAPHERLAPWTKREAYDRLTAMYLDCRDDAVIAREVATELRREVSPGAIADIRLEAALAAEHQPHDVRLRWIYRFTRLTVNNLVKEYMALEGKTRFLEAKRELAEEIDTLVRNTPPAQLCVAVNDALGRNTIGVDILKEFQAYVRIARKMDTMIAPYAKLERLTPLAALEAVAARVAAWHETEAKGDQKRILILLARMLRQHERLIANEDLAYLVDCRRLQHDDAAMADPVTRILAGADLDVLPASVLDQIVRETGVHLPYTALRQFTEAMRSGAVLRADELARVKAYADRHLNDIDTLHRLGRQSEVPEPVQKIQVEALQALRRLAERHLVLCDAKAFFSHEELGKAARYMLPPTELQMFLDRLNSLTDPAEMEAFMTSQPCRVALFGFPFDRYRDHRFRLP